MSASWCSAPFISATECQENCVTRVTTARHRALNASADQRITRTLSRRGISSPITGPPGGSPATSRPPEVCASASSRRSSSATPPVSACGSTQSRFRRLPRTPWSGHQARPDQPSAHTAEADAGQRPSTRRGRQVIAVPTAATAAAASSQERLASKPDTAKNPNAHTSQVVLIWIIISFAGAAHPYLSQYLQRLRRRVRFPASARALRRRAHRRRAPRGVAGRRR
jgi:hypothetical protein